MSVLFNCKATKFIIEVQREIFKFPFPPYTKVITRYFIKKRNWLGKYEYITVPWTDGLDAKEDFYSLLNAIHHIYNKYNTLSIRRENSERFI